MKRIFNLIALATLMSSLNFVQAQSDVDALRYSMLDFGSTARAMGAGGAFGALGGDFSVLSTNPAGLGLYRSSELVFTPSLAHFRSETDFIGNTTEDDKYNFHLSNFGIVFNKGKKKWAKAGKGWKGSNFGIGVNRIANYNNKVEYSGYNEDNSLTDNYVEFLNMGNGTNPSDVFNSDPFGAGLAYEAYLINPFFDDTTSYYSEIADGDVQQIKSIETSGGMDEMVISLAGNYNNRFYVGGTIGVPFIHYNEEYTYREEDVNDMHDNFESFDYESNVKTTGAGINFKFGMLFKVNDYLRLGGAIHTPTLFYMEDNYFSQIRSSLDTSGTFTYDSPRGTFDYHLVTPWRVIGSAALVFKQFGFFTVDYEWLDYREASFDFDNIFDNDNNFAERDINNAIEEKYTGAHQVRAGAEFVVGNMRLRGGYGFTTTPFKDGIAVGDADLSTQRFTAGIGYKEKAYFVDLAYVHTWSKNYDAQYQLSDPSEEIQGAEISNVSGNFMLSMGFRF